MARRLYALSLVLGVVLVALGIFHVAFREPQGPLRLRSVAPSQTTDVLTPGTWGVYDRAGTGPYGSAVVLNVSVAAPDGSAVPLIVPSSPASLHDHGVSYAESATMRIPTAGSYVVSLTPTNGPPVRALVTESVHPRFPWSGLIIDGVVLVAFGAGMTAHEKREGRTLAGFEGARNAKNYPV
jgi:hypothetical protein